MSDDDEDEVPRVRNRGVTLSKETTVTVSLAIILCTGAISFHVWLAGKFDIAAEGIARIEHKLETVEKKLSGSWGASDMKVWELELQRRNPTLNIPDSWSIFRQSGDGNQQQNH